MPLFQASRTPVRFSPAAADGEIWFSRRRRRRALAPRACRTRAPVAPLSPTMDSTMSDPALVDPSSTVNMILKKAKTPLGKRSLMKKAPKLVETEGKMCLLLHGGKSSQVLKDLGRTSGC